ncbi:MAG: hypothetical protein HY901_28175 [Deltaproteobacteria bacterium]|nr:hypothetical protein [Deltaproteobacteria bacterium]
MSQGMRVENKVFAATLTTVVLTVVFQCVFFPWRQLELLSEAVEGKTSLLGRVLALEIAPGLQFKDNEAILDSLKAAVIEDVVWAAALSADGTVITAHGPEPVEAALRPAFSSTPRTLDLGDSIWATWPVTTKGGGDGLEATLGLRVSKRAIQGQHDAVLRTAFLVGLLFVALGAIVAWLARRSLTRVLASQKELVQQINHTAVQLNAAAGDFLAGARQQERGASEQSSAVEETRRTMTSLLESGRVIAQTAHSVLEHAEHTQENSQVVADRIAALSAHSRRITEISEVIKEIANKSDLLALNAALEGTKAGEAGRGFSLVATQMQKLAENVMGSVRDIKDLAATITAATQASVLATEESTKLATDTTLSARQIAQVIQQQQSGTEQVTLAMNEVSKIAQETTDASAQNVRSSQGLIGLSETLQTLVARIAEGSAELASQETRPEVQPR